MKSSDTAADRRAAARHSAENCSSQHHRDGLPKFAKLLDNADLMLDQIRAFKLYSYHGARKVVLLLDIWGTFDGGWHMARVFQDPQLDTDHLQMDANHTISVARLDC